MPSSTGEVGQFYDTMTDLLAEVYGADLHMGYWSDPPHVDSIHDATSRMTDQLIERLGTTTGDRVLDVGCGTGQTALRLAGKCGVEVFGVSISKHQIEQARLRAQRAKLEQTVHFEHADAMCLPYPANTFDMAWAIESLGHMELDRALAEIVRVLRPGGRLVIADGMLDHLVDDATRTRIESLCQVAYLNPPVEKTNYLRLLSTAGLQLIDITDITDRIRHSMTYLVQAITKKGGLLGDQCHRLAMSMQQLAAEPEIRYVLIVAKCR